MFIWVKWRFLKVFVLLIGILNLAACGANEGKPNLKPTEQFTPTAVSVVESIATPFPTETSTPTPSPTSTSTPTSLPSPTATSTSAPTLTATPTPTPIEVATEEVPDFSNSEWHMIHVWGVENWMLAMAEDHQGGIWLGGRNLLHFDGQDFAPGPQTSIGSDVRALLVDSRRNLWIAGGVLGNMVQNAGVAKYDGQSISEFMSATEDSSKLNPNIPFGINFILLEDKQGNIWLAAKDEPGTIALYDGQNFSKIETSQFGLTSTDILPILADSNGNIWLSGNGSLYRWDGQNLKTFTEDDGWLPGFQVTAMAQRTDGSIWIAGRFRPDSNWGILSFTNDRFAPVELPAEIDRSPATVNLLHGDRYGRMWIVRGDIVYCLKDNKVLEFTTGQDLPPSGISAIAEDGQGRIWFGSLSGVSRYEPVSMTDMENTEPSLFPSPTPISTPALSPSLTGAKQEIIKQLPYRGSGFEITYAEPLDSFVLYIFEAPVEQNTQNGLDFFKAHGFDNPQEQLNISIIVPRTLQY